MLTFQSKPSYHQRGKASDLLLGDFATEGAIIVLKYTGVAVDVGGITAFGNALVMERMPSVALIGSRQISVEPGTSQVTRAFQASPYDLRSPAKVSWTGGVTANPPNGWYASVMFDYSGLAPGGSTARELRVSATDVDGLCTEPTVLVEIFMTKSGDNIPPECVTKPWLPQCR